MRNWSIVITFIVSMYAISPSAKSEVGVRGLEALQMSLDEWTHGLESGRESAGSEQTPEAFSKKFVAQFQEAQNSNLPIVLFYEGLLKYARSYTDAYEYKNLSMGLLIAKEKIRYMAPESGFGRSALSLLQLLSEESLFIGHKKFPDEIQIVQWESKLNNSFCDQSSEVRGASLNGLNLCQGDVVLSKGSAGSSSFLARFADIPGNYSHSTIAVADKDKGLLFLESFIEDGLKLRSPQKDYIDHRKSKLAIYRYTGMDSNQVISQAARGVDRLIEKLERLQQERFGDVDLFNRASLEYDFAFDIKSDLKVFCSEVAYIAYKMAGYEDRRNPYSQSYWSRVSGTTYAIFKDFLGVDVQEFASPSDVELNPSFALAGISMNAQVMANDRVDNAMIDSLLLFSDRNSEEVGEVLKKVADIGNQTINKQELIEILNSPHAQSILPPEQMTKLRGMLDYLPSNATLKQSIFFAYLNFVLTPRIREAVAEYGQTLGPVLLRKMISQMLGTEIQEFQVTLKNLIETIRECRQADCNAIMNQ